MINASVLLLAADSWGGVAAMITLAAALHGLGVNARIHRRRSLTFIRTPAPHGANVI
jgi:hypothetical protein